MKQETRKFVLGFLVGMITTIFALSFIFNTGLFRYRYVNGWRGTLYRVDRFTGRVYLISADTITEVKKED